MEEIKFSIITVTYNSEKYLERTIKSVLDQTYGNIEYIIIDGLSKDGTVALVKKYEDRISHFKSEKDKNMYDAINKGMAAATGDYIAILNSDDFYIDNDVLSRLASDIAQYPGYDGYYGNLVKFDVNENVLRKRRGFQVDYKQLLFSTKLTFVGHGTLFISSACIKNIGEYDYISFNAAADYDFVLRCFKDHSFKYLNIDLMGFRTHSESITATGKIEEEKYRLLEKHCYFKIPTIKRKIWFYLLWSKFILLNIRNLINKLF